MVNGETSERTHDDALARERLRDLYGKRLQAAGRCTIEQLGGVGSGHAGAHDPTELVDEIADLSLLLRRCSDEERVALEVDIVHDDLPPGDDDEASPGQEEYRVPTEFRSKCQLLAKATHQSWTPERLHAAVRSGLRKVTAALRAGGELRA